MALIKDLRSEEPETSQIEIIQALVSEGAAINYFEPRFTNSTLLAFAAIGNRIESIPTRFRSRPKPPRRRIHPINGYHSV
jgi:hypothetical protein